MIHPSLKGLVRETRFTLGGCKYEMWYRVVTVTWWPSQHLIIGSAKIMLQAQNSFNRLQPTCGKAYSDEDIQLLPVDSCVLSFQPEWAPGLELLNCVHSVCYVCVCGPCPNICLVCFFVPYDELKANMIAGRNSSISTLSQYLHM